MNSHQPRIVPQKSNQSSASGSTLVVGLVILLVLTIFGVMAMQAATLQERMAGNLRDRELAFQAAEAALREAEAFVQQTPFPPPNTAGFYGLGRHPPPGFWDLPQASRKYQGKITGVAAQPRYIIEELPPITKELPLEPLPPPVVVVPYRITARAVGGTDTAVVILQTIFKRGDAATTGRQSWRQLQ